MKDYGLGSCISFGDKHYGLEVRGSSLGQSDVRLMSDFFCVTLVDEGKVMYSVSPGNEPRDLV